MEILFEIILYSASRRYLVGDQSHPTDAFDKEPHNRNDYCTDAFCCISVEINCLHSRGLHVGKFFRHSASSPNTYGVYSLVASFSTGEHNG